jgi:hypothetical protein
MIHFDTLFSFMPGQCQPPCEKYGICLSSNQCFCPSEYSGATCHIRLYRSRAYHHCIAEFSFLPFHRGNQVLFEPTRTNNLFQYIWLGWQSILEHNIVELQFLSQYYSTIYSTHTGWRIWHNQCNNRF